MIALRIREKFFVLAGVVGLILAVVSAIGYYFASTNLEQAVSGEITASMNDTADKLDGWLGQKKQIAVSVANVMAKEDDGTKSLEDLRRLLAVAGEDENEVSDLIVGNRDEQIVGYRAGDLTAKMKPTELRFYKEPQASGQVEFMDTYVDKITGKLVVSIAAPYKDASGAYRGAICEDIFLDILQSEAQAMKYHGEGTGYIIDNTGKIIATEDSEVNGQQASDVPAFAKAYEQMTQKPQGFLRVEKDGASMVLAYATVPSTKWIAALLVPQDIVLGQLSTLKFTYAVLTLLGILIVVLTSLRFSGAITRRLEILRGHAEQLASGDLSAQDIVPEATDEIGDLTQSFNAMKNHIKELIGKMRNTSEQVAASSEELTASAHQSADAATNVAQTVSTVADGMTEQTQHVDNATKSVEGVLAELDGVAHQTKDITGKSSEAAESAEHGQKLMGEAIDRMAHIETSVGQSADVVAKLGESSKEIGTIIETIAGIADQTNLLALNAAIEAARAGEQGRGFSVVADEVRKLAEQSQGAAEEIRRRIETIQSDTDQAVAAMKSGTEEVQSGVEAIRAVGDEFSHIMQQVTDITAQMTTIDAAVQNVSKSGDHISTAVAGIQTVSQKTAEQTETISAATEEQSASNEEIAAASQALAKMAAELQDMAAKFKI